MLPRQNLTKSDTFCLDINVVRGLDQIWLGIIRFNTGWRNGTAILLVSYVLNILYGALQARFFSV